MRDTDRVFVTVMLVTAAIPAGIGLALAVLWIVGQLTGRLG